MNEMRKLMDIVNSTKSSVILNEDRATDLFRAATGDDRSTWENLVSFLSGSIRQVFTAGTEEGTRYMKRRGFSEKEIKLLRDAIFQGLGDFLHERRSDVLQYEGDDGVKPDESMFVGWATPYFLDLDSEDIKRINQLIISYLRKHMMTETTSRLNESNSDAANQLEEIYQEIKSMMWEAREVARRGFGYDSTGYERAKYWISAIETALDKDHDWLGGNMFTMVDTIQELRGEPDEADEYMEEDADFSADDLDHNEFVELLYRTVEQHPDIVRDGLQTSDDEMVVDLFNNASNVNGSVTLHGDGTVSMELYREGKYLDAHYWEGMDAGVVKQIVDLIGMPLENTW